MNTLAERVKYARGLSGLTQEQVSELTGMKQPTYQKVESGKSKRTTFISELSSVFGVNPHWLMTGQGEMTANVGNVSVGGSNNGMIGGQGNTQNNYGLHQTVLPSDCPDDPPAYLKDMPLLDIDMGVAFVLAPNADTNPIFDTAERVATFIPHSGRTFGIKNNTDITGITPSTIHKSDILIVEPCIAPRDNDLVLLCLDYGGANRGVIARLFVDLVGNRTVKHNDSPATAMPNNALICGVVVEIKRRLLDTALAKARLNPSHSPLSTLEPTTANLE